MTSVIILYKENNNSDIINEIKNIPKDLNNFKNYFKHLCVYGILEYTIIQYQKSIENNILEINDKNQIKCDENLNIYFNDLFNLVCQH
jgi:hypothetical protein